MVAGVGRFWNVVCDSLAFAPCLFDPHFSGHPFLFILGSDLQRFRHYSTLSVYISEKHSKNSDIFLISVQAALPLSVWVIKPRLYSFLILGRNVKSLKQSWTLPNWLDSHLRALITLQYWHTAGINSRYIENER